MNDLNHQTRVSLALQLHALKRLRSDLSNQPELAARCRFLARSLRRFASGSDLQDLAREADAVDQSKASELPGALNRLIRETRRTLRPNSEGLCLLVAGPGAARDQLLGEVRRSAPTAQPVSTLAEAQAILAAAEPTIGVMVIAADLPDGDGRALLTALREDASVAQAPSLIVGLRDGTDSLECLALGATECFEGPTIDRSVSEAVEVLLGFEATGLEFLAGDPRKLTSREELVASARARAEDYALLRGESWCVALFQVTNHTRIVDGGAPLAASDVLDELMDAVLQRQPLATVGPQGSGTVGALFHTHSAVNAAFFLDAVRQTKRRIQLHDGTELKPLVRGCVVHAGGANAIETFDAANHLLEQSSHGDRMLKTLQMPGEARKNILVVEDDPVSATLVEIAISDIGFTSVRCATAEEALAITSRLGRPSFALYLIDVQLPTMTGFDLLDRLREAPGSRNVPAVFMSADGSDRRIMRGLSAGADDFLVKPFGPKVLAAKLQAILARRSRGTA